VPGGAVLLALAARRAAMPPLFLGMFAVGPCAFPHPPKRRTVSDTATPVGKADPCHIIIYCPLIIATANAMSRVLRFGLLRSSCSLSQG
jgi:hypothetical protein